MLRPPDALSRGRYIGTIRQMRDQGGDVGVREKIDGGQVTTKRRRQPIPSLDDQQTIGAEIKETFVHTNVVALEQGSEHVEDDPLCTGPVTRHDRVRTR